MTTSGLVSLSIAALPWSEPTFTTTVAATVVAAAIPTAVSRIGALEDELGAVE